VHSDGDGDRELEWIEAERRDELIAQSENAECGSCDLRVEQGAVLGLRRLDDEKRNACSSGLRHELEDRVCLPGPGHSGDERVCRELVAADCELDVARPVTFDDLPEMEAISHDWGRHGIEVRHEPDREPASLETRQVDIRC
jgi:hypothetical protein